MIWILYAFSPEGYAPVQILSFTTFEHCQESMRRLNRAGIITSVCTEGARGSVWE